MPLCELQRNLKQSRQHVHMLMPVHVRRRDSRIAHFLNLRVPLVLHFRQHEPAPRAAQKQALGPAREFAVVVQKAGYGFPLGHRPPPAQLHTPPPTQPPPPPPRLPPPPHPPPLPPPP